MGTITKADHNRITIATKQGDIEVVIKMQERIDWITPGNDIAVEGNITPLKLIVTEYHNVNKNK